MKIRLLLVTLISALAVAPGLQAQDQPKAKQDQTELGAVMDKISADWRAAKRLINEVAETKKSGKAVEATKTNDVVAKLAAVKQHMEAAMKLEPALKAEKPADEQPKFVADYRAKMKEEIEKIDKLTALVKAGDTEEAGKLIGVVDQDQKDAHKQFKKQKKKKQD